MSTSQVVLLLIPVILIELGLLAFAIRDLLRAERRVRGGNKGIWALVIVFVSLVGPIIYLMLGREEE